MNLVLFFTPTGRGWSWRSPASRVEELWGAELPVRIAQEAERAKFDAILIGSWLSAESGATGQQPYSGGYEPFTLMSAMAARTERIGFIGTASTTFVHPYNMARYMTSLDWLSAGRIGWNVVTSVSGERHYGIEMPPHDERYARAEEYVELTKALWDAWDDDAVIEDRAAGVWARADSVHPVDFEGRVHKVQGHLFMHRSPQGWPVIVQAGQSSAGMEFAAAHAEVVFTAQTDIDAAKAFRREMKDRAAAAGRDQDAVKILPGLMPVVGRTASEAKAFESQLNSWAPLELVVEHASALLQADLSGLDLDQPIPPERLTSPDDADSRNGFGSRYRNFYDMAVEQKMTLREFAARSDRNIGHSAPVGSADEVADLMQEWYEAGACDGWAVFPTAMPEQFDAVCQLLVPELQRRGIARSDYQGTTLRDHLGLERPAPRRSSTATAPLG